MMGKKVVLFYGPNKRPKSSSSGYFIATAVYGSYEVTAVKILRYFGDNILMSELFGRFFCFYLLYDLTDFEKKTSKVPVSYKILEHFWIKKYLLFLKNDNHINSDFIKEINQRPISF
jgi:hypothetical protein